MGNISDLDTAQVLVHALPYIQKYYNKTIVVKYGGNAMINEDLKNAVMTDMVLLSLCGIHIVIVHGGGPEITDMLKKIGKESRFVNGLRYTDEETMDIVQMVLAGKVNKELVSNLQNKGGHAIGMCGLDGGMIKAEKLNENGIDYGLVGNITAVDATPIKDSLSNGYIPVIATMASDADGGIYNINADTAAARIAAEIKAEKLILLTDMWASLAACELTALTQLSSAYPREFTPIPLPKSMYSFPQISNAVAPFPWSIATSNREYVGIRYFFSSSLILLKSVCISNHTIPIRLKPYSYEHCSYALI